MNQQAAVATNVDSALPAQTNQSNTPIMAMVSMIERVAMNPDVDPAKLGQFMDLQERVLDREARQAFDSDFAKMQAELPAVEKLADGHNSKYAKFEHIIAAVRPVLVQFGFAINHRVMVENQLIHVTGILSHKGGHREETTISLPPDTSGSKNAPQAVGSSTEYGRRYTTNSLLGIATKDADTDGNASPRPQHQPGLITKAQEGQIMRKLNSSGYPLERFLELGRINSVGELQANRFDAAMNSLNSAIGKMKLREQA